MVKYFKEKMVNDMKRKAIYKLSFKAYLKAMMIFIVFIMICSISFFFYIKKDIENSLNKLGDGNTIDEKALSESLKKDFKTLYNLDSAYQESIKNFNGIKGKDEDEKENRH